MELPLHPTLDNAEAFATPTKRPGQKSFDEWLATENPVYHGTARPEFGQAPTAHYGTIGQAADRLETLKGTVGGGGFSAARYFDPSLNEDSYWAADDEIDENMRELNPTGRVHARRFTEQPMRGRFTDAQANAAEMGYRLEREEEWDIPASVRESTVELAPLSQGGSRALTPGIDYENNEQVSWPSGTARPQAGARALSEGRPIKYRNVIEGDSPVDRELGVPYGQATTSFVAPSHAVTSWERDVLKDPNSTSMAQDFAKRRISSGQEGAVPFPSPTIPSRRPEQLNLRHASDISDDTVKPFPVELTQRKQSPERNTLYSMQFGL